jgi:hypothetical protein
MTDHYTVEGDPPAHRDRGQGGLNTWSFRFTDGIRVNVA